MHTHGGSGGGTVDRGGSFSLIIGHLGYEEGSSDRIGLFITWFVVLDILYFETFEQDHQFIDPKRRREL